MLESASSAISADPAPHAQLVSASNDTLHGSLLSRRHSQKSLGIRKTHCHQADSGSSTSDNTDMVLDREKVLNLELMCGRHDDCC